MFYVVTQIFIIFLFLSITVEPGGTSASEASSIPVKYNEDATEAHAVKEIDMEIAKLVQAKQESDSSLTDTAEEPMKIHIWDFAGQELYYTTHQVIGILYLYDKY